MFLIQDGNSAIVTGTFSQSIQFYFLDSAKWHAIICRINCLICRINCLISYLMLLCVTKVVFNIVEHSISEDVFIDAKEGNRNDKGNKN